MEKIVAGIDQPSKREQGAARHAPANRAALLKHRPLGGEMTGRARRPKRWPVRSSILPSPIER
jgi:hypothetical protein